MSKKQAYLRAKNKAKKGAWFVPLRGSFIPVSTAGWITYIPFTAYLFYTVFAARAYTGNDFKAVLWIVPNWVAAVIIMTWIAERKS